MRVEINRSERMSEKYVDTYYGKVLDKRLTEFHQKHKKPLDIKAMVELQGILTTSILIDCVNDLDKRIRKLEKE